MSERNDESAARAAYEAVEADIARELGMPPRPWSELSEGRKHYWITYAWTQLQEIERQRCERSEAQSEGPHRIGVRP